MTAVNELAGKIRNITECSICKESFKEPKILPCIHTFCLQCLDTYCQTNEFDEEAACPLCRKVFSIPSGGVQNLPNNFFMIQLQQVNKLEKEESAVKQQACEWCSDSENQSSATSYCIECDQHICDRCSKSHKNQRVSKSHQVVLYDKMPSLEERIKLGISYCEQYPAEQNRFYCDDCKVVMCCLCVEDKHTNHKWTSVNKSAEKCRELLKNDIDKLSECGLESQEKIKQIKTSKEAIMETISSTRNKISRRYDELVSLLQSQQSELLDSLKVFQDKILKKMETDNDETERQFVITESFRRYCLEMLNKGSACDCSRMAHDLHARAEELVMKQAEPGYLELNNVYVSFTPSLETTVIIMNFFGELILKDESESILNEKDVFQKKFYLTKYLTKPSMLHVLPSTGKVWGITALGSDIFVVCNTSEVNVYNSNNYTLTSSISIPEAQSLIAIVSCSHHNCFYVSDSSDEYIHRWDIAKSASIKWSVSGECWGLSVSDCHNLLAVLKYTNRMQEFSTNGDLIREICLEMSMQGLTHCVQLSTRNLVVSQDYNTHEICTVNTEGQKIQSYGGSHGSCVGQLYNPYQLTVDTYDNVLVTDFSNNKVRLFSSSLTHLGDLDIPGHQLNQPYAVHFDKENNRVYIGEHKGMRVFVLGVVSA